MVKSDRIPSDPSLLNEDYVKEVEELEELAREKVSSTLSAIDVAITSYDAAKKKPPGLKPRVDRLKKIKNALEKWERESLINAKIRDINASLERLTKFSQICDAFA